MSKKIRITESELINVIQKVILESENETKKPEKKELKKNKDFITFAQLDTLYSSKIDPNDRSVLMVKESPQSDNVIMEIDLGFNVKGCEINFIKHDGQKVTLMCSPKF